MTPFRLVFICTGNICRSPTAEAVMRALVHKDGLSDRYPVDSAGTSDFHDGEGIDPRAAQIAQAHGYDTTGIRARAVRADDFLATGIMFAMTREHLRFLEAMAQTIDAQKRRCRLALFAEGLPEPYPLDVPDPYYGGQKGFEDVLTMIEAGCQHHWQTIKDHA
ncbi:MAG: low molecular weight phosphotyrosine protein phosphatase [Alphaproteobacteria bacterium GM202ARS2]|nr:low molecular weight phosphotyrosine protein phosphatase [Alphaproteobacteria bacterium GM202ARS2]